MATLQTTRQSSSFTAKARLKQTCREHIEVHALSDHATAGEHIVETLPARSGIESINSYKGRLSEIEQRHLLLQTVTVYEGWHLISVQNRPESDVLVAYLVRNRDQSDPAIAIREGRAMQIIMDAVGDMKVQHPRRKAQPSWMRWMRRFTTLFTWS